MGNVIEKDDKWWSQVSEERRARTKNVGLGGIHEPPSLSLSFLWSRVVGTTQSWRPFSPSKRSRGDCLWLTLGTCHVLSLEMEELLSGGKSMTFPEARAKGDRGWIQWAISRCKQLVSFTCLFHMGIWLLIWAHRGAMRWGQQGVRNREMV